MNKFLIALLFTAAVLATVSAQNKCHTAVVNSMPIYKQLAETKRDDWPNFAAQMEALLPHANLIIQNCKFAGQIFPQPSDYCLTCLIRSSKLLIAQLGSLPKPLKNIDWYMKWFYTELSELEMGCRHSDIYRNAKI